MVRRREEGGDSSGPARPRSAALSEERPVSLLRAASGAGVASLKAEPPSAPSSAGARMEAVSHVTSRMEKRLKKLPIEQAGENDVYLLTSCALQEPIYFNVTACGRQMTEKA